MKTRCLYDKLVKVTDLKTSPKNRNKHPKDQIERLAKILLYQGWRYPVKVSKRSGLVTSGHGRIEAAKLNKWAKVPVNFQDYDNEEQEYADVQADNAIASWAEFDVGGINIDLPELGPDFDIDMLGLRNFLLEPADKPDYNKEWNGMPEFHQEDKTGFKTIAIHFHDEAGVKEFSKLVGQPITQNTRYLWYPEIIIEKAYDKRYGASDA